MFELLYAVHREPDKPDGRDHTPRVRAKLVFSFRGLGFFQFCTCLSLYNLLSTKPEPFRLEVIMCVKVKS